MTHFKLFEEFTEEPSENAVRITEEIELPDSLWVFTNEKREHSYKNCRNAVKFIKEFTETISRRIVSPDKKTRIDNFKKKIEELMGEDYENSFVFGDSTATDTRSVIGYLADKPQVYVKGHYLDSWSIYTFENVKFRILLLENDDSGYQNFIVSEEGMTTLSKEKVISWDWASDSIKNKYRGHVHGSKYNL